MGANHLGRGTGWMVRQVVRHVPYALSWLTETAAG